MGIRKPTLYGCLLASSALAMPALAQEYQPPAPPPIRETIDSNGVDLTRGTMVSRSHGVSIGGPGRLGLQWARAITSDGDWRDSTAVFLSTSGATNIYTVSVGGASESFTLSGGNYVSNEKTGSTLTLSGSTYTYTTPDGTVYKLDPWPNVVKEQYSGTHRVSTITYPTGEKLTFNWEIVDGICIITQKFPNCELRVTGTRLTSVEATNAYKLQFEFEDPDPALSDSTRGWAEIVKVTALNMSVDPASQTWPALNISESRGAPTATFTDSLNRTTSYAFTSGILTGIRRPGAQADSTTISWTSGKVNQVVNNGVTTNYSFSDASGVRTATISDAITGNRVVKTNLATMLVTSDQNEAGKTTNYAYYSGSGLLQTVTAPEGNKADFEYDARGNLTKTTLTPKSGSPLSPIITEASYPASSGAQPWKCATAPAVKCNKPETTTDAMGNITNYAWDSTTGQPTSVKSPAPATGAVRPETRYGYTANLYGQYRDAGGVLHNFPTPVTRLTSVSQCQTLSSCSGAADEVKTTITYGTANVLPVSASSGSGNGTLTATSAFTYDAFGNRITVDGPLSGTADTTKTFYDAVREIVGIIGPDPDGGGTLKNRAQRLTYNADGQVKKQEIGTTNGQSDANWAAFAPLQAVDIDIDPATARETSRKLSSGATDYALTQTSYDSIGRVDCTAVRMNPAEYASLPASACTLDTQGSYGPDRISKMTYDAVSRPTKVTTGYGTGAAADEVTATYTDNGQVKTVKDGENNLTTYEYDGLDRLSKTRFPLPTKGSNASSTTDYELLTYDANSNVTNRRLRDGVDLQALYDKLDRLTWKKVNNEPENTYAYDNLNRLTSATRGTSVTFAYDALSRNLNQVSAQGTIASEWDLAGRRTKLTYPDGFYLDYDHLVTGEVAKVRENGATSGIGVLATYAFDPATSAGKMGLPTSVAYGNGGSQAYGYDPIGRLTSLTVGLAGTASDLTKTFDYNPANQIVEEERDNDAYAQAIGNGTQATVADGLNRIASVNGTAATHDARGNLTTDPLTGRTYSYWVSDNQLKNVASPYLTMGYDALSRLRYDTHGSTVTNYVSDGPSVVAEYDNAGGVLARFAFGGLGEPLVAYDSSGARSWMQSDERGSVVALADDSAAMTAINTYDEYGVPGASNAGAFQYAGQMWMSRPGVYYSVFREYAPQVGRFLQTDPIGYDGGMNLYAYTGNDPVNYVDPLGLRTCSAGAFMKTGGYTYQYTYTDPEGNSAIGYAVVATGVCVTSGSLRGPSYAWDPTLGLGGGFGGGGGGGGGNVATSKSDKVRPEYCSNVIYKLGGGFDTIGKWGQRLGIGLVTVSPIVARASGPGSAGSLGLGVAFIAQSGTYRLTGDILKWIGGGPAPQAPLIELVGKYSGVSETANAVISAVTGEVTDKLHEQMEPDPCQTKK